MMATDNKIIVGLSGGVDSSVAAFLLLEKGYEVEALFMKNWDEDDDDEYCSASQDLADAQQVADQLGIKLHTVNFSHEYWEDVFEHFLYLCFSYEFVPVRVPVVVMVEVVQPHRLYLLQVYHPGL